MDQFSGLVRVLFLIFVFGVSYSTQVVYPYGPSAGDAQLRVAYEVASEAIRLSVPVKFYNDTYETIFVNSNGLVSFDVEMPMFFNVPFPLDYPAMAAFYANIDLRGSGQVYYRQTHDPKDLSHADLLIGRMYPRFQNRFAATMVFVATWHRVGYYQKNADKTNTFQVALITDGQETFVMFVYPSPIQWVQSFSGLAEVGLPDAKAQAGFSAADGRIHVLRGSGSDQMHSMDRWSNTDVPGIWLYRVGNIGQNENVEPPESSGSLRPDEGLTCAVAGAMCHNQASCVDYEQGDMCCICKQGYFGNGITCIKEGIPVRVGGKVSIDINGINVPEADLQAYVSTQDGRVYMAISSVPIGLGYEMQYLSTFPSVAAWLFSLHSEKGYNGYQLTGGVVNYTSEVTFPGTEHRITIHQRFFGLNSFDQLVMDATVQGTTPSVPLPHTRFTLPNDNNKQQYTIANSRMHSYYTYRYKQDGSDFEQQVTVSQTFEFAQPCNRATKGFTSFSLHTSKAFAYYEDKMNILRLVSTNNIFLTYEDAEDPCSDGQLKCVANSTCVRDGSTFRCECNLGFHSLYGSESGCLDINECQDRIDRCDSNAICVNEVGTYSCQCKPGFEGNGYYCEATSIASSTEPSSRTYNIENSICDVPENISTCSCIQGYEVHLLSADTSDFECVDVNECNVPGICHRDSSCTNYAGSYSCTCHSGFVGDGYKCLPLPPTCRLTQGHRYVGRGCPVEKMCVTGSNCFCPPLHEDAGEYCVPSGGASTPAVQEPEYTTPEIVEPSISCAEINTCHAHAQCNFVAQQQRHRCQCNPGYEGDGYECSIIEISCEKSNICDMHASCQQTREGYSVCVCNRGYEGDGILCTPNEECVSDSSCGPNEKCAHNETSYMYSCTCVDGYEKNEYNKCQRTSRCVHDCHKYASCVQLEPNNYYACRCYNGYRGNGVTQCDRLVETGCTENSCPANAECRNTETSFTCSCAQGYTENWSGSELSCMETCAVNNSICHQSAQCVFDSSERYVCQCRQGFIGNGQYCKEIKKITKEDIYLLVNQGMATLHIPTVPNKTEQGRPVHLQFYQIAIGLAVDCLDEQLYWSDITASTIKSAKLDGSMVEEFTATDAKSVEGLAVDWINRKLYWTDSGLKRIMSSDLSNKTQVITIAKTSVSNPRGIAVHPNRRKIFWTDWNRNSPKIEWSNLDGSQREIFVQGPNVQLPNSIAVDWYTDEICWADAGLRSIECIGIDSRLQRTAVANCSYPFGLAITRDNYYWTDWISEKIEFIDRNVRTRRGSLSVPLVGNGKLYGMVAVTGKCP